MQSLLSSDLLVLGSKVKGGGVLNQAGNQDLRAMGSVGGCGCITVCVS